MIHSVVPPQFKVDWCSPDFKPTFTQFIAILSAPDPLDTQVMGAALTFSDSERTDGVMRLSRRMCNQEKAIPGECLLPDGTVHIPTCGMIESLNGRFFMIEGRLSDATEGLLLDLVRLRRQFISLPPSRTPNSFFASARLNLLRRVYEYNVERQILRELLSHIILQRDVYVHLA